MRSLARFARSPRSPLSFVALAALAVGCSSAGGESPQGGPAARPADSGGSLTVRPTATTGRGSASPYRMPKDLLSRTRVAPVRPDLVGGAGGDDNARVGALSSAHGSFVAETGGSSEADNGNGSSNSGSNSYSLQMNTNLFSTSLCNSSNIAGCQGWEQFVYDPQEQQAFIEYSLVGYGGNCGSLPDEHGQTGWASYDIQGTSTQVCWYNTQGVHVPAVAASALTGVSMTASATFATDTLTMTVSGTPYTLNVSSVLGLATGWNDAEFNIFGENGGSQAVFNSPTSLEVQVNVTSSTPTRAAPSCSTGTTTGETNTLSITAGSCCPFGGDSPGVQFVESNTGAAAPACPAFNSNPPSFTLASGGYGQAVFTTTGTLVGQSTNTALQPKTCNVNVTGPATAKFDPSGDPVSWSFTVTPGAAPGSSATAFVTCDTDPVGFSGHPVPITVSDPLLTVPSGLTVVQGSCTSFEATVPSFSGGAIDFGVTPATFAGGGTIGGSQFCYTLGCDGYGDFQVCAGLKTPPGPYAFDLSAGWQEPSGYGYVSEEDTVPLPVQVLACVPETTAVACNSSATYTTCGAAVPAGCGTTVDCTCSGASSCSNGVCCPSGLTGMSGTCCAAGDTVNNGMCCPPSSNNCSCPSGQQWNPSTQSCTAICPSGEAYCACADECISTKASCAVVCKNLNGGGCSPAQAKAHQCS